MCADVRVMTVRRSGYAILSEPFCAIQLKNLSWYCENIARGLTQKYDQ